MDNKEKTDKFKELFKDSEYFRVKDVVNVNHRPHPYTIGTRHIKDAADNHMGRLGKETIEKIPCAFRGCSTAYEDHTSDNVLFLQLKQNVPNGNTELQDIFNKEKEVSPDYVFPSVDGVTFVETTEKFRFLKEGE